MDTMEKYKEKLKLQNVLFTLGNAVLLETVLLSDKVSPVTEDSRWADFWVGFIHGAAVALALAIFMLAMMARNIRALKDETALKKRLAKDNDERCAQIIANARSAAMQTFLLLGLVAIVVAGYFSVTVSLTILGCVVLAGLLSAGFKLYYNKKF